MMKAGYRSLPYEPWPTISRLATHALRAFGKNEFKVPKTANR
jgi:hypothetical protein